MVHFALDPRFFRHAVQFVLSDQVAPGCSACAGRAVCPDVTLRLRDGVFHAVSGLRLLLRGVADGDVGCADRGIGGATLVVVVQGGAPAAAQAARLPFAGFFVLLFAVARIGRDRKAFAAAVVFDVFQVQGVGHEAVIAVLFCTFV